MRTLSIVTTLLVGGLFGSCLAYEVPVRPLEERIAGAEFVFTGTVLRIDASPDGKAALEIATLKVNTILKGQLGSTTRLVSVESISEMSPRCCIVGHTYLIIGKRAGEDGLIRSVDGPYGVFDVAPSATNAAELTWPGSPGRPPKSHPRT